MSCEKHQEMISAFIDNELDENEIGILRAHLEICPDCSRLLKELSGLWGVNKKTKPIPMPPEIEKCIIKLTIKSEKKWPSPFSLFAGSWRIPRGLAWLGIFSMLYVAGDLIIDWNRSPFPSTQIGSGKVATGESVQKIVISDEDLVLTSIRVQPKVKIKGGLL